MGKLIRSFFIFILLTAITQVGGILYLLYKPAGIYIARRWPEKWNRRFRKVGAFGGIYLMGTLFIIPYAAAFFGRVTLPWRATREAAISPRNLFYPLANRHYVRAPLKEGILDVGRQMKKQYPGVELRYLDANFPFWDGFRLLPHLSHDDGGKLDLCYLYRNENKNRLTTTTPSIIGYGAPEAPHPGEVDQPATCARQGYWQYNIIHRITPSFGHDYLQFDGSANKTLLTLLARDHRIGKIFIEPHLQQRLGLSAFGKIRYHGCRAVRHDDHIHIQL